MYDGNGSKVVCSFVTMLSITDRQRARQTAWSDVIWYLVWISVRNAFEIGKDFKSLFKLLFSGKSHKETSFSPSSVCRTELHIILTPQWWMKVSGNGCSLCVNVRHVCVIVTVSLTRMAANSCTVPFIRQPSFLFFILPFFMLLFCCFSGFRLQ